MPVAVVGLESIASPEGKPTPEILEIEDVKPVLIQRRREYLHGKALFFAFLGWLMTEFMGGLVSQRKPFFPPKAGVPEPELSYQ